MTKKNNKKVIVKIDVERFALINNNKNKESSTT